MADDGDQVMHVERHQDTSTAGGMRSGTKAASKAPRRSLQETDEDDDDDIDEDKHCRKSRRKGATIRRIHERQREPMTKGEEEDWKGASKTKRGKKQRRGAGTKERRTPVEARGWEWCRFKWITSVSMW